VKLLNLCFISLLIYISPVQAFQIGTSAILKGGTDYLYPQGYLITDSLDLMLFNVQLYGEVSIHKTFHWTLGSYVPICVEGPRQYSFVFGINNETTIAGLARLQYKEALTTGFYVIAGIESLYINPENPLNNTQFYGGVSIFFDTQPCLAIDKFNLIPIKIESSKKNKYSNLAKKSLTLDDIKLPNLILDDEKRLNQSERGATAEISLRLPSVIRVEEAFDVEKNFPLDLEITKVTVKIDGKQNTLYNLEQISVGHWKTTVKLDETFREPLCIFTIYSKTKQGLVFTEKAYVPVE